MNLAERATAALLIWNERSVRRRAKGSPDTPSSDGFSISLSAVGGMDGAKDIPYVDAAFDVNLDAPDIEINYQLTCRFFFENDVDPPAPAEATEFMRDYGVSYALGYVNAALASDSSAFRVRNYAIPVLALNDVKSLVTSNESDTDTPG